MKDESKPAQRKTEGSLPHQVDVGALHEAIQAELGHANYALTVVNGETGARVEIETPHDVADVAPAALSRALASYQPPPE